MMAGSRAAIVGVGATEYYKRGRSVPRSELELIGEAVHAALAEAGLTMADVDGITGFSGGLDNALVGHQLGIPEVRFCVALTGGGGGSAGSIGLAATAVEAGVADVVVTVMVMLQAGYRLGQLDASGKGGGPYAIKGSADKDFSVPFGMVAVGAKFAMVARRHMHLFGTTRDHFAEVAMSTRANALNRPTALMRTPMTREDYYAARMVTDPLCLFDFCLESDGAVAVVTTSAQRAKDLRQTPVHVLGSAMGGQGRYGHSVGWVGAPDDYFASSFHRPVAEELYRRADRSSREIDVALLYDHFTPMVLMQLEDYGFCGRGESGPFVADGNIRFDGGKLPLNPHGGNLSEAYIMGMTHVKEAVEQLRGTAINQVAGARTALVTGGPAGLPVSGIILGADA